MDTKSSVAHVIENIITQLNSTSIKIGQTEGHFISLKQVAVLEECVERLEGLQVVTSVSTPTTSEITQASSQEDAIRARRKEISTELRKLQTRMGLAATKDKGDINKAIGKLLSERAKIDKITAQLEAL